MNRIALIALLLAGCGLYVGPPSQPSPDGGADAARAPDARVAPDASVDATPPPDAAPLVSCTTACVGQEIYCRPVGSDPPACWCLPSYTECAPACADGVAPPCGCGTEVCLTATAAAACVAHGTCE